MKKRLLSLALALCLVCSLLPGTALAAGENPFTDVSASHWAHDDITYVYENDLMNGTDGSLFSPESTTTRAQVVTVLYRLAGQPAADWENPFWDVPASAWFHDAVTWAWENDITGGVSSTQAMPSPGSSWPPSSTATPRTRGTTPPPGQTCPATATPGW